MSRLRPAIAALVALSLAGCAGMTRTVAHQYPQPATAARIILQDAGASGPVLVEVRGNPFAGDIAAAFAAGASGAAPGLPAGFTPHPAAAPRPDTRLVVQFYPGERMTADQVCGPAAAGAQRRSPDQLTAFIVFCQGARPVLAAMQWAPLPDNAQSPIIGQMAEQAVLRMFVTDNDSVSPSDYWPD
jgi:hypothetical protein